MIILRSFEPNLLELVDVRIIRSDSFSTADEELAGVVIPTSRSGSLLPDEEDRECAGNHGRSRIWARGRWVGARTDIGDR